MKKMAERDLNLKISGIIILNRQPYDSYEIHCFVCMKEKASLGSKRRFNVT